MKLLTGSALALTISLGAVFPAFAGMVPSGEINGEVQSINGSTLTVRSQDGSTQEFLIDPDLASALNLEQGRSVLIDGSRLMRGFISGVDDNTVKVTHDNGEIATYILTRESRRYLSYGDRVVVDSQGIVVSEDRYMLTATEITPIYDYVVASSTVTGSIAAAVPAPEPVVQQTYEPVQGMW
ncbi:MAG: hypothetical protein HC810_04805 [Acaryochloridaceae cyanobacterium RL_2_7]|nr:hypothetical protein [Acaryochloridaceae cyanobacterium RL_2_7]